jgi:hypothetical protein
MQSIYGCGRQTRESLWLRGDGGDLGSTELSVGPIQLASEPVHRCSVMTMALSGASLS